ncbi:MAG: ABC transporter permease [Chloroflexota bacterium]
MQSTLPNNQVNRVADARPVRTPRKQRPAGTAASMRRWLRRGAVLVTPLLVLFTWMAITGAGWVQPWLVPPPDAVADKFIDKLTDGEAFIVGSTLWQHTVTTLSEVLIGLGIGVLIGVVLGYWIARIPLLEDLLSPLIVAFQSTPIVAYAPLLVIAFGSGITGKIVTCVLIVFFPMLMNTVAGIRGVPRDLRDLMRVSRASWWQTFTKLELPAAMPVLVTGLKTSATLAVIGAVVGEFVVADAGLGFLINVARQGYDTALVYVAAISLALMAGTLYAIVSVVERRLLAWQRAV